MDAKTLAKYLIGGPELLASAVTGSAAEPIAGWGGILAKTLKGEDRSTQAVEGIRDALTYQPRSPVSAELASDLGDLTPDIIKELSSKYSALQDEVGAASPTAGAAMATIPTAAGMLVPYAGRVKAVASNVPDTPLNRQAGILRGLNDEEALLSPGVAALKQGGHPAEVWQDYGVGEMPGMPGKYFDEIDDSAATVNEALDPTGTHRLSSVLKHPELYSKMPVMRLAEQVPEYQGDGSWTHGRMRMGLSPEIFGDKRRSVALHEAGHGVAELTGLPRGTNPGAEYYAAKAMIDELKQKKSDLFKRTGMDENIANDVYGDPNSPFAGLVDMNSPEWAELSSLNDDLYGQYEITNRAAKRYEDTYGEAIARMAEARKDMTAAERRASYPFEEATFQRQTGSPLADVLRNFRRE